MPQSLTGTFTGLYAACQACYATSTATDGTPVLVSLGDPGQYQPLAIVAVMDLQPSQITRPTLGTNRSRELAADLTVMFSVYTPGGVEAHLTSLTAVTDLIRLLEDYLRVHGNETLGLTCRDSWVAAIPSFTSTVTYDPESVANSSPVPTGRTVEATVTVTALIRY